MSATAHTTTHNQPRTDVNVDRRVSTETKASFKTTELIAYVVAVLGVLIASAVVDASDFGAQEAWFYVSLLTIGYMVSRGLAKSGSRDFYDDDRR
jgi:F420-0:gamma-glutamyl ligase